MLMNFDPKTELIASSSRWISIPSNIAKIVPQAMSYKQLSLQMSKLKFLDKTPW